MTKISATRTRHIGESGVPSGLSGQAPGLAQTGQAAPATAEDARRLSVIRPPPASQPERPQPFPGGETAFRDFLEGAAIGMHTLASDGTVLWANRTSLALLGYREDRFVGRPFGEFFTDAAEFAELQRRVTRAGSVSGAEFQLRCGDGSRRWFRIDASPHRRDGELHCTHCCLLEISDKRNADEAKMRLAAIVESSDDAIASKDLTGVVTSWNAAAQRILGYSAEEMVGRSILTIIPPELHKDEPEILRRIQAGERIEHFETIRVRKTGERIHVSLTVSPVRDDQGRIVGAAKILRDITEQKKLEDALRTTERLASVGRLAATVAHEINNPLEAVTNLLYLACHNPGLPEAARNCLTMADEELKRVAHIARQTLGFYRDTSSPVRLAVGTAVGEILAIYDRRLHQRNVQVASDIPEELDLCILQGEFKQIVSNLVSNAIDASPQRCRISVRGWASRHPETGVAGIRLVVADEGTGIPESLRQKIFTPFFTTKRDVGTGLGLWIVRDLLLRRGGSILCRSRAEGPRTGTVMMVFLPGDAEAACEERRASLAGQ